MQSIFKKKKEEKTFVDQAFQNQSHSIFKSQIRESKYVTYIIKVPAHSNYTYIKNLERTSEFNYANIIKKESSAFFNDLMKNNTPFFEVLTATDELLDSNVSENFLKSSYQETFNGTVFEKNIQSEDYKLSAQVQQEIKNDSNEEQIYKATFNLTKIDVIAKTNDIITVFTIDSELNFNGFELVE